MSRQLARLAAQAGLFGLILVSSFFAPLASQASSTWAASAPRAARSPAQASGDSKDFPSFHQRWADFDQFPETTAVGELGRSAVFLQMQFPGELGVCGGMLIGAELILTNLHCAKARSSTGDLPARIVAVFNFGTLRGQTLTSYDCSTVVWEKPELDSAILRCQGRPADFFQPISLSNRRPVDLEAIAIVHHHCPPERSRCADAKKVTLGRVIGRSANVNIQGLPTTITEMAQATAIAIRGSSGSPVIGISDGAFLGITFSTHHTRANFIPSDLIAAALLRERPDLARLTQWPSRGLPFNEAPPFAGGFFINEEETQGRSPSLVR
jgi:hypothetical protein